MLVVIDWLGGQSYRLSIPPSNELWLCQPANVLLVRWKAEDREVPEKLVPVVYKELREIARHDLQQSALGILCRAPPRFTKRIFDWSIRNSLKLSS